jgi:hypothetical protein
MPASARTPTQERKPVRFVVLAAVFLSASVCLETPLTIYFANRAFFDAPARDALLVSGAWAVWVALLLALPGAWRSPVWRRAYAALLAALGVTCWLNSNLLVGKLGTLRGDAIDLASVAQNPGFAAVGGVAFFGVALLAWLRPKLTYRGLQVFLFAVLGSALVQAAQASREPHPKEGNDPGQDQRGEHVYEVSRTANAFIIIYDAFQNDIFQEIVASYPASRRALQGFTLFTETLGVSGSTTLAIPAMLSGEQYRFGESIPDYMQRASVDGSFLTGLVEGGHDVAYVRFRPNCPRKVSCFTAGELQSSSWQRAVGDYAFLLDLSVLRALPGPAKNLVFNDGAWLISRAAANTPATLRGAHSVRDLSFFRGFIQRLRPVYDRPAVRAMHLLLPHSPLAYDEHCVPYDRPQPWTREFYVQQATCALRSFVEFSDRLRELGLYDDSLIVVAADHGAGFGPVDDDGAPTIRDATGRDLLAYAHPLLAVKPPGARGELQLSASPVQLTDIRSTVCSFLKTCTRNEAPSVFDARDAASRGRRFDASFLWTQAHWDGDYPGPFTSYDVRGPVRDVSSWRPVRGDFPAERLPFDGDDRQRHSAYGVGWKRDFHLDGERSSRWAVGKRAVLYFRLPQTRPVRLRCRVRNWHKDQAMSLTVNGRLVHTVPVPAGDYTDLFIQVPGTAIDRELSELAFDFTRDGTGEDTWLGKSHLAVLFDEIAVEPAAGSGSPSE